MNNIIDLSKLPVSDGRQVINIIGLNHNGNVVRAENDTYSKAEIDGKLADVDGDLTAKQDVLVSGKNIATINGKSLLEGGNIVVEGGSGGADLTGYATEQWVKNQGYVTDSDVNDYVENEIGQVEEKFNDYYTKTEVDGIVANVGGGGGKDEIIVGLTMSGNSFKIKTDDVQEAYSFNKPLFYSFSGSKDAAMLIPLSIKFNMVKTDDGLEHTSYYVWGYLNDGRKLEWTVYPEVEQTEATIVPAEGGDSGVYILEGIEPILEVEFWYHPETGEYEVIYENNSEYSTSEERKAHNKKVIDAILEGKCKSLYYKKFVGNVDEKVIEVDENGREHKKTVNGYQYYPLSWTEYEGNWGLEYIRFDGKFIEGYMHTPKERVIVLNKETAEIQADSQMTYAIGNFMDMESVFFSDEYKMERRIYDVAISNTKPVCLTIEGESTISRCFLKTKLKNDFETNTEQGIVWCDDVDGNRYEWLFEYNMNDGTYNEFAIPTITPMGGGSGDSYTKDEIDGMIGDINNILETI